jgi:hypothetical protein
MICTIIICTIVAGMQALVNVFFETGAAGPAMNLFYYAVRRRDFKVDQLESKLGPVVPILVAASGARVNCFAVCQSRNECY